MSSPPKPWETTGGSLTHATTPTSNAPTLPTSIGAATLPSPSPSLPSAITAAARKPLIGGTTSAFGGVNNNPTTTTTTNTTTSSTTSLIPSTNDPNSLANDFANSNDPSSLNNGSSQFNNMNGLNNQSRYGMNGMGSMNGMGGYGSSYGMNGMNGYGMNGYGMNGGMGLQPGMIGPNGMPLGPFGKVQTMMHHMDMGMQRFGRISQLVHMNFDALAMSFSSMLRFVDHAYLLRHEMANVGTTFTTLKFMSLAYDKINRAVRRVLGQDVDMADAFADASKIPLIRGPNGDMIPDPNANLPSLGIWGWIIPCLTLAILWTLVKKLWRRIFPGPPPPTEEEKMAEALKEQELNKPIPLIGQDGKPVIGPNGQPVITTQAQQQQIQQQQMAGMGVSGMGGYGMGGYGMGGYGSSGYGMNSGYGGMGYGSSSMYGGMGGYGMGSSYGGYGSSMYGGGYGSSYGSGYGSSMYGSSYGGMGGMGGMGMY